MRRPEKAGYGQRRQSQGDSNNFRAIRMRQTAGIRTNMRKIQSTNSPRYRPVHIPFGIVIDVVSGVFL
jgi:hypothetical protein